MKIKLLLAIFIFLTSNSILKTTDLVQENSIETIHVSGNYYLLKGGGVNVGVSVGKDGILIIDDHYASLNHDIRAALKELGAQPGSFEEEQATPAGKGRPDSLEGTGLPQSGSALLTPITFVILALLLMAAVWAVVAVRRQKVE